MTRTRSLAASLLSLSTAAILALAGAGSASAAPSTADKKSPLSVASATVDSTGAAEYWTADRMRAAIPGDVLAGKALERGNRSSTESVEKGKNRQIKGTQGKPTIAASEATVKHIGKVFFTMGASNYVCSGNAVTSDNQSTVATAGHCVSDGPDSYATNFAFVPAYENGSEPYGRWTAKKFYVPQQWNDSGNMAYDTAFVVMKPQEGTNALLTVAVGGSGVEFHAGRGLTYQAFGYPAAKPFDGQTLKSCTGTATDDPNNPQFNSQGISCDMTGGSSGGPWLISTGDGVFQNSINSYGYSPKPVMYGPYWGAVIEATYNFAAAA